jgi:hypothetical protein
MRWEELAGEQEGSALLPLASASLDGYQCASMSVATPATIEPTPA